MGVIKVQKLEKSFGIETIFRDVSFELRRGERVGLVGANGAGKSTLLRCLLGMEEYDQGFMHVPDGETIGYLQQNITFGDNTLGEEVNAAWQDVLRLDEDMKRVEQELQKAIGEAQTELMTRYSQLQERFEWLGGYEYEAMSRRIIHGLGFSEKDLDRKVDDFSGGQKTRVNLAKALVRRPDYLFLDEPTNHLDMDMLEWLENYLAAYGGGILIVSHDRYFLDRVATSILELENKSIIKYKGNYTRYVQQKQDRRKAQESAYEKQQEYIQKTEEYIRKYKAGIKSKQARGRQSQLNRLERVELAPVKASLRFSFAPVEPCADKVLVLDDLKIGFDDKQLFNHLSAMIRRGEAIALIGPNGAGKSTLLKMIMGEKELQGGHITIGSRVHVGYFSQEHTELHPDWTVVEELMYDYGYSEDESRTMLGSFMFYGDDVFKTVGQLSGGEQARLELLKLFLQGANFLILDEPTNHLDIPTREVVEQALLDFGGTYLVVSHDRYFLDKIAKRTLLLDNGILTEYLGNYTYYRDKEKELADIAAEEAYAAMNRAKSVGTLSIAPSKSGPPKGESKDAAKSVERVKKGNAYQTEKILDKTEMKIAELEATKKMYEYELNDPSNHDDSHKLAALTADYEKTTSALEEAYSKWERLSEELES